MNFKKEIQNCSKAKAYRSDDINSLMDIVEVIADYETNRLVTVEGIGHCIYLNNDWGFSIGSYSISIECTYRRVISNTFIMNVTYELHDEYDWDKDVYSMGIMPVSPRDMWELHLGGYAKNFEVYGVNTFTINWTAGQTFEEALISNET